MNILIAPDSFKGSLSAGEAAMAIESGIKRAAMDAQCTLAPMADGGEGTASVITDHLSGGYKTKTVTGPNGSKVTAHYGFIPSQQLAVIEMKEAVGLPLSADINGSAQIIISL